MTYRCPHHIRIGWIQRELICKTMSFRIKYQSLVAFFINQLYALQCKRLITSHTELKLLSHKYQTASIVAVFCMRKQMFQLWIVIVIGFLCCVHNNHVRLIICINILVMEMHIRLPLFNHTYSWPEGTTNWRFCLSGQTLTDQLGRTISLSQILLSQAESIILHPTGVRRHIGIFLTQPIIISFLLYLISQCKSLCELFW